VTVTKVVVCVWGGFLRAKNRITGKVHGWHVEFVKEDLGNFHALLLRLPLWPKSREWVERDNATVAQPVPARHQVQDHTCSGDGNSHRTPPRHLRH